MCSRNTNPKTSGFTMIEILIAATVFGMFTAALMTTWTALAASAANTTAYAQRQNDQMRILDYLKRDIRRATAVAIYSGGTLVTGTAFGDELRLTIPDYYADSREDDVANGPSTANAPVLAGGNVTYGTPMTVRYYLSNGAVIRDESGVTRAVTDSAGVFTLSYSADVSGLIRCRVLLNETMRSSGNRALRRQVDVLCGQRAQLFP